MLQVDRAAAAELLLAALFAGQAFGILAGSSTDVSDQEVGTRIASALAAREVIAQA